MQVTHELSKEERQFRLVLRVSAVVYAAAGLAFAIAPEWILGLINSVGDKLVIFKNFDIPTTPNKFWVSLTFSMMMTITLLCYLAQRNVRKAVGYVGALLTAKLASTLSALCFFIFSPYFGYLVIVAMDGSLFLITLYFFLRANHIFFEVQTAYLRKAPVNPKITPATKVVVLTGKDKFDLLDRVLAQSGFFEILEKRFQEVEKTREAFSVVVKPNFMFMHAKEDRSSYTDPELVEALIDKIVDQGFTNVSLVESQCTYGNYYHNREVANVAAYIGYSAKNYRIVDLTVEGAKTPYDYGGRLGQHFVGPTWRDAHFRISFAKNKTHVFSHYTLTLKNIYGTLPLQNKIKEYHSLREYDWPTIETMKHFPVHFGLIDAFVSADGPFGVIVCNSPKLTKTIIGGENLIAVDYVGATKMRLDPCDPRVGRFLSLAVEALGRPEKIDWVGDKSFYEPWQNVNEPLLQFLDLIEEAYDFANWWFLVLTAMDDHFPLKKQSWGTYAMRKILAPAKRHYYLYDDLKD